MADGLSETDQIGLGIAAIAAAFAKTMQDRDPGFSVDFLGHLQNAYRHLREVESPSVGAMQMVQWTGELIEELK